MIAILFSALSLGLVGSAHCASMCGPLAIAGCSGKERLSASRTLGYFSGRLLAYAFMGAVFGGLGRSSEVLGLELLQRVLLGGVAAFMVARGIGIMFPRRTSAAGGLVQIGPRRFTLSKWVLEAIPARGLSLGLITGGLPCGMLVAGWALAASTGDPFQGALVMAALFAGSSPALIASLSLSALLGPRLARTSPILQGAMWCVLGGWIAVRPLLDTVHDCVGA